MPKDLNVLVVGDWVVDEYWMTGTHRTRTAARVGRAQLRSLHDSSSVVQALVGAGRIASLMRTSVGPQKISITGVGLWHRHDNDHIEAMFDTDNIVGWNPNKISRTIPSSHVQNAKLVNIANLLGSEIADEEHGTSRVIRIYRKTGNEYESLGRVDWELPPEGWKRSSDDAWINENVAQKFEHAAEAPGVLPDTIDAVVIKDLCKGVVSDHLIEWLVTKYSDAPWFVSTKAWCPAWLGLLHKVNLKLLLIPQVAARLAGIHTWFTNQKQSHKRRPTKEAMDKINEVWSLIHGDSTKPTLVALPFAYSLIARDGSGNAVFQSNSQPIPFRREGAMASTFFASFCSATLRAKREPKDKSQHLHDRIVGAMDFVESFASKEERWRENPEEKGYAFDLPKAGIEETRFPASSVTKFSWNEDHENWERALRGLGTIERAKETVFDPSYAMTHIEGYVCCQPNKRMRLARLIREIREHTETPLTSRRNISGLLLARPGSGKTSLVRGLANTLNLHFLDFNVTQINSRDDLIDCFDTILTTQAQQRGKPLLVFFDEINAKIQNEHVFDAFLAPLDDGLYQRAGKKYQLQPCVWFFASTQSPKEASGDASNKASDFESRLSLDVIDLSATSDVERVYCGVMMLQRFFPDVRFVSTKVLECFSTVQVGSLRELNRFTGSFQDVQYGRVSMQNVPRLIGESYGLEEERDPKQWIKIA